MKVLTPWLVCLVTSWAPLCANDADADPSADTSSPSEFMIAGMPPNMAGRAAAPQEFVAFTDTLASQVEHPDHVEIDSLFFWGDTEPERRAAEVRRIEQLRTEGQPNRVSFVFKDLDRLPEQAREFWSKKLRQLTTREASVWCVVVIDGHCRLMLPLKRLQNRLLIVPSDVVAMNN